MTPFLRQIVILASRLMNSGERIYAEDFDACADTYDTVKTRPYLADRTEQILRSLSWRQGMSCLDLGCGTGHATRLTAFLAGPECRIRAYDISEKMIARAGKTCSDHGNVEFRRGGVLDLLSHDDENLYDLVTAFWSLEYIDPAKLLKQVRRVLKTGGRFCCLANLAISLKELQDLVAPIVFTNLSAFRTVPPLNFPESIRAFGGLARKAGLFTERLDEEKIGVRFETGSELVQWMKEGGPAAGFRNSIKPKERDRIFGLIRDSWDRAPGRNVTFRFLAYEGVKK